MKINWDNLKPGVNKSWLYLLAGLMWTGAGFFLIRLAFVWITNLSWYAGTWYGLSGMLAAGAIYKLGFSRLAEKNMLRIDRLSAKRPCLFAFQDWESYLIIPVMMGMGIALRSTSFLPRPCLGVVYLGIGGGLLAASLNYYLYLFRG